MTNTGHVILSKQDEVIFGRPASEAAVEVADRLGAKRIFLMVSGTLNRETDEIDKLRTALGERCVGTFDNMPPHTPRSAVIEATNQAREAKIDLIITLGGGSITDGAKGVSICLANDFKTVEDMDGMLPTPGPDGTPVPPNLKPLTVRQISIPTTLSGGEFNGMAGITDEASKAKQIIKFPTIIPQATILDPAVTTHTPEWLWLSTGVRALDHGIEGVCALKTNAFGDAHGYKSIELLSDGLRKVKADASDLDARLDCQLGTWMSFSPLHSGAPVGASHGIGYILGALYDVPHGHTSCVMLPSVLRWNKEANADRQAQVASALGRPGEDAADALESLIKELGMPTKLSDVDIGPDKFDKIAEASMAVPWIQVNPRPIPSPAQVREILELAA